MAYRLSHSYPPSTVKSFELTIDPHTARSPLLTGQIERYLKLLMHRLVPHPVSLTQAGPLRFVFTLTSPAPDTLERLKAEIAMDLFSDKDSDYVALKAIEGRGPDTRQDETDTPQPLRHPPHLEPLGRGAHNPAANPLLSEEIRAFREEMSHIVETIRAPSLHAEKLSDIQGEFQDLLASFGRDAQSLIEASRESEDALRSAVGLLKDDALSAVKLLLHASETMAKFQYEPQASPDHARAHVLEEALQVALSGIAKALDTNAARMSKLEQHTQKLTQASTSDRLMPAAFKAFEDTIFTRFNNVMTRQGQTLDALIKDELSKVSDSPDSDGPDLDGLETRLKAEFEDLQGALRQINPDLSPLQDELSALKANLDTLSTTLKEDPRGFTGLSQGLLEKIENQGKGLAAAFKTDIDHALRQAIVGLREDLADRFERDEDNALSLEDLQASIDHALTPMSEKIVALQTALEAGKTEETPTPLSPDMLDALGQKLKTDFEQALSPVLATLNNQASGETAQVDLSAIQDVIRDGLTNGLEILQDQITRLAPPALDLEGLESRIDERLRACLDTHHAQLTEHLSEQTPTLDTDALSTDIRNQLDTTLQTHIEGLHETLRKALDKGHDDQDQLSELIKTAAGDALDKAREHIRSAQLPELDELALMMRTELDRIHTLSETLDGRVQSLGEKIEKALGQLEAISQASGEDTSGLDQDSFDRALESLSEKLSAAEDQRRELGTQLQSLSEQEAARPQWLGTLEGLETQIQGLTQALSTAHDDREQLKSQRLDEIVEEALRTPLRALAAKMDQAESDRTALRTQMAEIAEQNSDIYESLSEPDPRWMEGLNDLHTAIGNLQDTLSESDTSLDEVISDMLHQRLDELQTSLGAQLNPLGETVKSGFEDLAELKNLSAQIEGLQSTLDQGLKAPEMPDLDPAFNKVSEEIARVKAQYEELTTQNAEIKDSLGPLSTLSELPARLDALQSAISAGLSAPDMPDMPDLRPSLSQLSEDITALKDQLGHVESGFETRLNAQGLKLLESQTAILSTQDALMSKLEALGTEPSEGQADTMDIEALANTLIHEIQAISAPSANAGTDSALIERLDAMSAQLAQTPSAPQIDQDALAQMVSAQVKQALDPETMMRAFSSLENRIAQAVERSDAMRGAAQGQLDLRGTSLERMNVAVKSMIQSFGAQTQSLGDEVEDLKSVIAATHKEVASLKTSLAETAKHQKAEAETDLIGLHHIVRDLASAVQDIRKASEDLTPLSLASYPEKGEGHEVIELMPKTSLEAERKGLNHAITALNATIKNLDTFQAQSQAPLPQDVINIIINGVAERLSQRMNDADLPTLMEQCVSALKATHEQLSNGIAPAKGRDFSASLVQLAFEGRTLREAIESQLAELRAVKDQSPPEVSSDLVERMERACEETKRQASELVSVAAVLSRDMDKDHAAA